MRKPGSGCKKARWPNMVFITVAMHQSADQKQKVRLTILTDCIAGGWCARS